MGKRAECKAHVGQSLPRTRYMGVREAGAACAVAVANVSHEGGLGESAMLNPSGLNPWAAAGRARRSIPGSRSRVRGREPSRFLGGKSWKKPETESIISEHPTEGKGLGVPWPQVFVPVPQNPKRAPEIR